MEPSWFTEAWRAVNALLSVPLLAAMLYGYRTSKVHLEVEDRLFIFGTVILVFGNMVGTLTGLYYGFPFNAPGQAFFSIAGCWLSVSMFLRIRRLRTADRSSVTREDAA